MKKANHHTRVMPYLIVAEPKTLIHFLVNTFNGKNHFTKNREDGSIQHTEVAMGDSNVMISQAGSDFKANPTMLYIYVNDVDANFDLAIKNGATPIMAPYDEDYGARSAGILGPCGNTWWMAKLN